MIEATMQEPDATTQVPDAPTLAAPAGHHIQVSAWCFRQPIDLRQLRAQTEPPPLVRGPDLDVRELGEGRFLALARFGIAVLWPDDAEMRAETERTLAPHLGADHRCPAHDEEITVVLDPDGDRVTDDAIGLRRGDLPRIRVVSLALAQSVGLDRIEAEVEAALATTEPFIREVRTRGRSGIGARRLLQLIGTAMSARQQALVDLAILDLPEEAWESPEIDALFHSLGEHL
ncbi:MAG: RMD1 family protein, partial [Myxococcales bacterium]|nr:RMD1 family protein [Myxococcales bacterium]